jgi:hypothetical protein
MKQAGDSPRFAKAGTILGEMTQYDGSYEC